LSAFLPWIAAQVSLATTQTPPTGMNSEGGGAPGMANALTDARHLHRLGGVEALQLAAEHRRPRDHGVEHPGQARVDAELRLAVDDDRPVGEASSRSCRCSGTSTGP
jgi:hypothetical protein